MENVFLILKDVIKEFDERHASMTFDEIGIDSFDLLTARIEIEQRTGLRVPDTTWITFRSPQDIKKFYDSSKKSVKSVARAPGQAMARDVEINMPQMAVGGLSESWLFKELGDLHWTMLCEALGSKSDQISDGLGNRLYPTFVRIRVELGKSLHEFRENERLDFECRLSRYGKSMFFSDCTTPGGLKASLATTFASRGADNKKLLKGEPVVPENSGLRELTALPAFSEEYRALRRGDKSAVELGGHFIEGKGTPVFETEYELNPYFDLNGVNLLYFAAYPLIHESCERKFMNQQKAAYGIKRDWALEASTVARDVFYYGNADLEDKVVFRINTIERLPGSLLKVASSIHRESDNQVLAQMFTIKHLHG